MLLYIIRHGETRLNEEGRLQGHVDMPLNEKGRQLAEITGEAFSQVHFDLAISSPLSRARETADLFLKTSGNQDTPMIFEPRLMEISWGLWDCLGCTPANYEIPDESYKLFFTDPFNFQGGENGESIDDVCLRTGDFYKELISNPDYQDNTILISTHGCALRAFLQTAYRDNSDKVDFWHGKVPPNCAINVLDIRDGKASFLVEDQIYYDPELCSDPYKLD